MPSEETVYVGVEGYLDRISALTQQLEKVIADRDELQALFDLQQERVEKLTHLWQAENDPDVIPDLGALAEWAVEKIKGGSNAES